MRRRPALLCSVLLIAACSGGESRRPPAGPAPPPSAAKAALPYESPARWEVHPSPLSYVTAAMRLADGRCLVTEHSGQRWLTWPARGGAATDVEPGMPEEDVVDAEGGDAYAAEAPNGCSGEGRAALERAPEPIVGIVRWASSYGFIGESGTIHEAGSPLGRFTRRIPPPEPLARVRGAGRTLLAVTTTGRVLRWDEERGFERADLEGAHAFDVAVSPSGRAVVLAAPEAIFTTEDGGRHFTRAAAPSIGVQRVAHRAGGPFLVEGVGTTLAWDPRGPATFASTPERIEEAMLDVAISAGRSASASLVTQGRAVIDGDRYWEAGIGHSGEWALWRGKLDGRLSPASLNIGGPEDSNVLVAVSGHHVAIGIVGWSDDGTTIRVRRSQDGGATFGEDVPLVLSSLAPLGIAVSRDGAVLVTGACRAASSPLDADEPCSGGPLVLRAETTPNVPRAASLHGPAIAPAFSPDGRSAYFLAEGEDDRTLSLFVSHDGGASFEERLLRIENDGDDRTFEAANETAISVSESGALGMALQDGGPGRGQVWVTTDADGRAVRAGEPPIDDAIMGGFGERVLAIARASAVDDDVPVWESLDGGATWQDEPAPVLLRGAYRRQGDVACGPAGCLVGEDATRIGWGGDTVVPLPFDPPKKTAPPEGLRTPIVCEPRPGSSWTRVDDVDGADLPDVGDAARGRGAWMVPTLDPRTGAAGVVAAMLPASGDGEARITTKQLLPPVAKGARWAFGRRPQIEGEAMARVTLDPGAAKAGRAAWKGHRIRSLEVAWENLEEGTSTRAVLPDAGTFEDRSVVDMGAGRLELFLDVLSVSPKGLFVRASPNDASTFFVETTGKARSFQFPGWPESFTEGAVVDTGDAVNVDGTFVMTSMYGARTDDSPTTILLARPPSAGKKPDEPWTPFAATIAPPAGDEQRSFTNVAWTYEGGHLAVWAHHAVPGAGHATAWMTRVLPDGTLTPPSRLATPYDLPKTPRPCSAAEHRDLPRIQARSDEHGRAVLPGTRHPVLIEDGARLPPDDELTPDGRGRIAKPAARGPASIGRAALLSNGVVLRGSPSSPCVDAFVARGVNGERVAAIVLGDLRQAWFFRIAAPAGDRSPSAALDVRPLTCRFDPAANVPDSVLYANASR